MMTKIRITHCTIAVGMLLGVFATGAKGVEFNLVDPSIQVPGDEGRISITVTGIQATLLPSEGTFNQDFQQFGIATVGGSENESLLINGSEELSISFSEAVRWDAFFVSEQGENECSVIAIEGVGGELFCGSGLQTVQGGVEVLPGQTIRMFASDSQGFSLATFAATATGAATEGNGSPVEDGGEGDPEGDGQETGGGNPTVRFERTGSGGGLVYAEYFDNANERTVYLGNFDTEEGTSSFEVEVPLGEGVYVYGSADDCSAFNGIYREDGSPYALGENGRYGPIRIDADTTIDADFAPQLFACGSCSVASIGLAVLGMGLMQHRRHRVARKPLQP